MGMLQKHSVSTVVLNFVYLGCERATCSEMRSEYSRPLNRIMACDSRLLKPAKCRWRNAARAHLRRSSAVLVRTKSCPCSPCSGPHKGRPANRPAKAPSAYQPGLPNHGIHDLLAGPSQAPNETLRNKHHNSRSSRPQQCGDGGARTCLDSTAKVNLASYLMTYSSPF